MLCDDHIFSDTLLCIKIVKLNILFRPEEAMFDNWQKLVSLYKYLVLFLRKLNLHDVKQNEKYPYETSFVYEAMLKANKYIIIWQNCQYWSSLSN